MSVGRGGKAGKRKPPGAISALHFRQFPIILACMGGVLINSRGKVYRITPPFFIGRARYNDLVLNHPKVALIHAVILRIRGRLRVVDLNSRTGLLVNGRRIGVSAALRPGDRLEAGAWMVVFRVKRPRPGVKPMRDPPPGDGAARYPSGGADGGHWREEYGLTAREDEMVFWLVEGKLYREIGVITGVTADCVHKHLRHAYPKLGVEHRHAAAVLVLDWRTHLPAGRVITE